MVSHGQSWCLWLVMVSHSQSWCLWLVIAAYQSLNPKNNITLNVFQPCGTDNGLNLNVSETVFTGNKVSLLDMGYASTNLKDSDRDEENRNVVQFRIKQVDQPNFGVSAEGKLEVVGKLDYESSKQHKLTIEMNNIGRCMGRPQPSVHNESLLKD
jgi:Cadherin domain